MRRIPDIFPGCSRRRWLELYHLGAYLAAASGKAVGAVLLALNLVLAGFFLRALPDSSGAMSTAVGVSCWLRAWLQRRSSSRCWCRSCVRLSITASSIICLPGWVLMMALGALSKSATVHWRVAAIAGVCGLSLASTVILYHRVTEEWRGVVNISSRTPGPRSRAVLPAGGRICRRELSRLASGRAENAAPVRCGQCRW